MERSMMTTHDRNTSQRKDYFWAQESRMSDGSFTYEVMFGQEEVYAALSEKDAMEVRDKFDSVLHAHNTAKAALAKNRQMPLTQRLTMLTYRFGYDSPEAVLLTEARELIERLAANQKA